MKKKKKKAGVYIVCSSEIEPKFPLAVSAGVCAGLHIPAGVRWPRPVAQQSQGTLCSAPLHSLLVLWALLFYGGVHNTDAFIQHRIISGALN